MTGMKKNVNFGLLILIIAILFCFSAAAIYYQVTFKNLSKEYNTKISELQKVTSTLLQKKAELAETAAKEQDLKGRYTGIREENEELEEQRDNLENQLEDKKDELLETKEQLRVSQNQASILQDDIEDYKDDIADYIDDIDDLCDYLDSEGLSHADCD